MVVIKNENSFSMVKRDGVERMRIYQRDAKEASVESLKLRQSRKPKKRLAMANLIKLKLYF